MKHTIYLFLCIFFYGAYSSVKAADATSTVHLCTVREHEQLFSYIKKHNCIADGAPHENIQIITDCSNFLQKHADKIDFQHACYDPETVCSLSYLSYACQTLTCGAEMVKLLCEHGADPNIKRSDGLYPATCCLLALVRLYNRKYLLPENTWHQLMTNQRKKLDLLYASAMNSDYEYVYIDSKYRTFIARSSCKDEINKLVQESTHKFMGQDGENLRPYPSSIVYQCPSGMF